MTEQIIVPLGKIKPNPYQPRTAEDTAAIAEIAVNIYRNGLMQVPSARSVNGHYELVFGHTRKAAFELLATQGVPAADIAPDKRFEKMPLNIQPLEDRQMFEMAVAENIKRRDLNPIEQATAMQRYMTDFQASSKQAAELFGVNDSTVRGKVRLLELPAEAQQKLQSGEISEGTARTLLSIKRVASDKEISDVMKKIEKNSANELPDETIDNYLERLQNNSKTLVKMWDDDRGDGRPRGEWRHSWLLDMKNFPNKLLPAVTPEDLAAAPGDDPQIKKEHLQNPPTCTACPFYTKVRGTHYCGNKTCHTRKTTAWHTNMLEMASKDLKIQIYDPKDGKYEVLDSTYHRSMFDKRDKCLRLMLVKGSFYQYFPGVEDDVFVVCIVGDGIARLPKRTSSFGSGTSKRVDYAEIKARKLYMEKRQELIWEFTGYAKSLLDSCPVQMLEILDDWEHLMADNQPPENASKAPQSKPGDYKRRLLIMKIVEYRDVGTEAYKLNKLVKVATRLSSHAGRWGMKFPKELMKKAVAGDEEVNSLYKALQARKAAKAKKAVSTETKTKKSTAAGR